MTIETCFVLHYPKILTDITLGSEIMNNFLKKDFCVHFLCFLQNIYVLCIYLNQSQKAGSEAKEMILLKETKAAKGRLN